MVHSRERAAGLEGDLARFEKPFHCVVIAETLKNQRFRSVLKNKTLIETDANFIIVVLQFAQTDALVQVRMAHGPLRLRDVLADFVSFSRGLRADCFQQIGIDADRLHASCFGSNLPSKRSYFPFARLAAIFRLNFSHSSSVTAYSWHR